MLRGIACRAFFPIDGSACQLHARRLRRLLDEALHARRAFSLREVAFTLEVGKRAAAQRLEVHDNGAAHFGRMLGEERLDAAVVGKLGTKSNEPHLSVNIAGREGIDLLNLFSGFDLIALRCRMAQRSFIR